LGLFPLQAQQKEEKKSRERIMRSGWILDIAHSLTEELLQEYFLLWNFVNSSYFNPEVVSDDEGG